MSKYIDGFVIPIPRGNLEIYKGMAEKSAIIWKDHGALDYRECVGDHMEIEGVLPFPKLTDLKPDQVVIFAYIVYESREHRDAVNGKVMADPRMVEMMSECQGVFDCNRMAYGGFQTIVGD